MDENRKLMEALAEKEHDSWSRWMAYLFSRCQEIPEAGSNGFVRSGDLVIPAALVEHWRLQARTEYDELSDSEQQADRKEVERILPLIDEYVAEVSKELSAKVERQRAQIKNLEGQLKAKEQEFRGFKEGVRLAAESLARSPR